MVNERWQCAATVKGEAASGPQRRHCARGITAGGDSLFRKDSEGSAGAFPVVAGSPFGGALGVAAWLVGVDGEPG